MGNAADLDTVLANLLTLGLLKDHVRHGIVLPRLVTDLPPIDLEGDVRGSFRVYGSDLMIALDRANSDLLPPPREHFTVDVNGRTVTMWTARFDGQTNSINTCQGAYTGLRELQAGFGISSGDLLRFIRSGSRHYLLTREAPPVVYPAGIFMRLGRIVTVTGAAVDGDETMDIYMQEIKRSGSAWFATDSLRRGMAQERVAEFTAAVQRKQTVRVYFMVGASSGGSNEIEYVADLLDLKSSSDRIPSPGPERPEVFDGLGRS